MATNISCINRQEAFSQRQALCLSSNNVPVLDDLAAMFSIPEGQAAAVELCCEDRHSVKLAEWSMGLTVMWKVDKDCRKTAVSQCCLQIRMVFWCTAGGHPDGVLMFRLGTHITAAILLLMHNSSLQCPPNDQQLSPGHGKKVSSR